MRIAIDARELLGTRTGVGRYLAELIARWSRDAAYAGHHLDILSHAPVPEASTIAGAGGAAASWLVLPGAGGVVWEQTTLARAAARCSPDVFFAPAYGAPLGLSCPVVVAMHDVSFFEHPEWFTWHEGLRRRLVAGMAAQRAARVLTLANAMRAELVRHLRVPADRVSVIAPAVDSHPAFAAPAPPGPAAAVAPEPLVLYVGSVFTRRNVPSLIHAFGQVATRVAGARLAVVGANRTQPRIDLSAYVAEAGVTGRVDLLDYVDDATLESLYRRARAFVFLSAYEGFGLTPLEAMARGVPAIVLDTPVAREACGDGALYASAPRAPEIVAWLHALLTDDRVHAECQAAGRRAAARWSWNDTARSTWQVFAEVAGRA